MKKSKLMILFHGYGSNGKDMEPLARGLERYFPELEVMTPDGIFKSDIFLGGFQWFSMNSMDEDYLFGELTLVERIISEKIDSIVSEKNLLYKDLILAGFSQGGALAIHLSLKIKEKTNCAISFAGGFVNPDNILRSYDIKKPDIYLIHGLEDKVLPYQLSEKAYYDLKLLGIKTKLSLIPNLDHSIDDKSIQNAATFIASHI